VSLAALQTIVLAGLAALLVAFSYAGSVVEQRRVSGVDCDRVKAGQGHISPWERQAC
jgi:hypothetical protein